MALVFSFKRGGGCGKLFILFLHGLSSPIGRLGFGWFEEDHCLFEAGDRRFTVEG